MNTTLFYFDSLKFQNPNWILIMFLKQVIRQPGCFALSRFHWGDFRRNQPFVTSLGRRVTKTTGESATFDEDLGETFVFAHHALVGRIVWQVALVDGERAAVAHALEHVPAAQRPAPPVMSPGTQKRSPRCHGDARPVYSSSISIYIWRQHDNCLETRLGFRAANRQVNLISLAFLTNTFYVLF